MKKILILINNDIGLYKFRKEFIKDLLLEHEVSISLPDGPFVKELVNMGCKFVDTEINRRGINPITDIKLIMKYQEILKRIKPDIIYTYTIKPNIYGGLLARINNIPYITTITGLGSSIQESKILQKIIVNLYKVSIKKAQRVFFQNIENFIFFQSNQIISKENTELVSGSGVNLNHFSYQTYPTQTTEINLIFIGRLMKEKGILELFKAAEYFKNKEQKIIFHILGFMEDNLDENLNKLIEEETLVYHGQQSDIRPFLKKSHAIIHPSYHEGMSNVLLEAAASGRPILASNIPGCREAFDEGVTGFGFESKSTENLIEAIEKFIQLPHEEKEKMGILGRQKMENEFDRQQVVDAYIKELNV